jgi:hypothetical protein
MKIKITVLKLALVACLLYFFVPVSFSQTSTPSFVNPVIQMGKVTISGKIADMRKVRIDKPVQVIFSLSHPISGEVVKKEIMTDSCGNYSVDLEFETNPVVVGLVTNLNRGKAIYLEIGNNRDIKLDFAYKKDGSIKLLKYPKSELTEKDMLSGMDILSKVADYHSKRKPLQLYNSSPESYMEYAKVGIRDRINLVDKDTLLSDPFKDYIKKDVFFFCSTFLFDYESEMKLNYRNFHNGDLIPDSLKIATPTLGYYSFMKDINLNSKLCLYSFLFPDFQEQMLRNDTLNISPIGTTPIAAWQRTVKNRISALIGFDNGQYYDVLTANSYARQLNVDVKPLSEIQKQNIHVYFQGGEIEKILLHENEKALRRVSSIEPLVVKDCSDIPDANHLIADILKNNVGKVIIVDLWATWCSPCLMALKEMRHLELPLKSEELAHVYITDDSSSKALWGKMIKEMDGQQYYLDRKCWENLLDKYSFEGVPSYLIFNKKGELKSKFTGYRGNRQMAEFIKDALKL